MGHVTKEAFGFQQSVKAIIQRFTTHTIANNLVGWNALDVTARGLAMLRMVCQFYEPGESYTTSIFFETWIVQSPATLSACLAREM